MTGRPARERGRSRSDSWRQVNGDPTVADDSSPDTTGGPESGESPADQRWFEAPERSYAGIAVSEYDTGGTNNGRVRERYAFNSLTKGATIIKGDTGSGELGVVVDDSSVGGPQYCRAQNFPDPIHWPVKPVGTGGPREDGPAQPNGTGTPYYEPLPPPPTYPGGNATPVGDEPGAVPISRCKYRWSRWKFAADGEEFAHLGLDIASYDYGIVDSLENEVGDNCKTAAWPGAKYFFVDYGIQAPLGRTNRNAKNCPTYDFSNKNTKAEGYTTCENWTAVDGCVCGCLASHLYDFYRLPQQEDCGVYSNAPATLNNSNAGIRAAIELCKSVCVTSHAEINQPILDSWKLASGFMRLSQNRFQQ